MLRCSQTEKDVIVGGYALLCLQLQSDEMQVGVFKVSDAGKRHLLLYIMSEPFTSDSVAIDDGDVGSEKASAVKHGLQRQSLAERDGCPPIGIDVTHASLPVYLGEVVCCIGVFHL